MNLLMNLMMDIKQRLAKGESSYQVGKNSGWLSPELCLLIQKY
jgi:hypothetical protein